jgi:hypothetical protein
MQIEVPIENQEIPQTGMSSNIINKEEFRGRKVSGVELVYDAEARKVRASWSRLEGTEYYTYQFYTSYTSPDKSVVRQGITEKLYCMLEGLRSGQRIYFRARSIGNFGLGAWSKPVDVTVP